MLLGTCWLLAGVFMLFQYRREKEYKAELMDERLQMHNERIIDDLRQGEEIGSIVGRVNAPEKNMRITLIDSCGNVIRAIMSRSRTYLAKNL